jgi:hypothetical protein
VDTGDGAACPHGVFAPPPGYSWHGNIMTAVCDPPVYDILSGGMSDRDQNDANANAPALLPVGCACLKCGERRADLLVWRPDDSGVDCQSCGAFFDPNPDEGAHIG